MPDFGAGLLADAFDPGLILAVKVTAFQAVGFGGVHGFSFLNSQRWGGLVNVFHTLGIRYVIYYCLNLSIMLSLIIL